MKQEGELARTHEGEPGLPRGRSSLPMETVRAAQRARLLRAVIAAVAEIGFRDVTVADIVRRARVSRAAFYAHFSDKEECFLAATREGGQLMVERVVEAVRKLGPGAAPEELFRAGVAGYLEFLTVERAFARAFYIDMPSAGPRAVARIDAAHHRFAELTQVWHERARRDHPDWPAVPYEAIFALSGAITLLVRMEVSQGNIAELTKLEDTIVALHLSVLTGRPWPAGQHGSAGDRRGSASPGTPQPRG